MLEEPKDRPSRIYGNDGNLYIYGGKNKKKKLKTSLKKNEDQKKFMSRLTGKIKFTPRGMRQERAIVTNKGLVLRPLEHVSSIKNVEQTDPNFSLKNKSNQEIQQSLLDKIKNNIDLTERERQLAALVSGQEITREIKNEIKTITPELKEELKISAENEEKIKRLVEYEGRNKKITDTLADFKIREDRFPISSWNSLNYGGVDFNQTLNALDSFLRVFVRLSILDKVKMFRPFLVIPNQYPGRTREQIEGEKIDYMTSRLTPKLLNQIVRSDNVNFPPPKTLITNRQLGRGLPALYNDEIEDYFSDEREYPDWGGVIASDQINLLDKRLPLGFIMNLDKSDGPGNHWVAVYISGDSVEYFDSFGDPPTEQFKKDIKKFLENMKVPVLMKFKINKIQWQNADSSSCGWHSIQFLDNRFNGVPFVNSTKFINKSKEGEENLKKEFSYI
jgi:hypothetical protein